MSTRVKKGKIEFALGKEGEMKEKPNLDLGVNHCSQLGEIDIGVFL